MQNEVKFLPIDAICPNVYQPRKYFNQETIDELAQSIKVYGIIQPLSVRKLGNSKFELVAGERRLRAAEKAGLSEVPVIVVDINDKDSAAIALLENLQREDLNYIEEAEAYFNLLKEHGYTQEQLSEVIGKKQSTIANKLRLLKLSSSLRKELLSNSLTERHARALLKLPNEKLQAKVLATIISKNLNVKDSENLIEKELLKVFSSEVAKDGKKRIKGAFSPKLYINTIKQVFDKCGVNATYKTKESDDFIEVTVKILRK